MNFLRIFIVCIVCLAGFVVQTHAGIDHLLPRPQWIQKREGVFSLGRSIRLNVPHGAANSPDVRGALQRLVLQNGGEVVKNGKATITVIYNPDAYGLGDKGAEGYILRVKRNSVVITAKTERGAYHAIQTLRQLNEGEEQSIPQCSVIDAPAWRIRGYMHDCGRSFMEFETLKKHIRLLSYYKINTFHWHLTENQGWRLESRVYPQLNMPESYTRHHAKYYTIEQARELVQYAAAHGVQVIPEIDMPGHSAAFRRAMGHSMLTPEGLQEMKRIVQEVCETFDAVEYIHIGTDEVRAQDKGTIEWTEFVPQIVQLLHDNGKKVMSWHPGYAYKSGEIDLTQMWSSSGRATPGIPAIDSRYHYLNHFDQYADVAGIYYSTIADKAKEDRQYAGVIAGIWNDRLLPSDEDIVRQNAFYPAMLAIAERAWCGGGRGYIEQTGVRLQQSRAFADWERRFLWHKAHRLKDEPISYVAQSHIRWAITEPFPNKGNLDAVFPPECAKHPVNVEPYTWEGKPYHVRKATGGAVYLRHVWGKIIPAHYTAPQEWSTAYAYTYVYSDREQTVGAQIETQNYSRSEADLPPPSGKWDYNGSRIWINGEEILPPKWENTHDKKSHEIPLRNENFAARSPVMLQLKKGWNTVLLKLPMGKFTMPAVRLKKWMFTFVLTTPDGKDAADVLYYTDPSERE